MSKQELMTVKKTLISEPAENQSEGEGKYRSAQRHCQQDKNGHGRKGQQKGKHRMAETEMINPLFQADN